MAVLAVTESMGAAPDPAIAQTTPAASKVPLSGLDNKIALGWIPTGETPETVALGDAPAAAQAAAEATAAAALAGHVSAADPHPLYALESDITPALAVKADLVDGKVPSTQLPAYVDDVLEYANLAAFPATGEAGKIYVAIDTGLTYRWSGTVYTEISKSLALGELSSTAYRGDYGKIAYDKAQEIITAAEITTAPSHLWALVAGVWKKLKWAEGLAAIVAGVKATAAQIVTGTSDLVLLTVKGLKDSLALADMWLTKRTRIPDGAAAVYFQDLWAAVDFWAGTNCTLSKDAVPGALQITATGSAPNISRANMGGARAKTVLLLVKSNIAQNISFGMSNGSAYPSFGLNTAVGIGYSIVRVLVPAYASDYTFFYVYFTAGTVLTVDTIWVGDYSYAVGSFSEEAARIANLRGDMLGVGAYASQTITATDLATAGKGDTIGGKKYTYVAALTASPGVEGEVLKEATKEAELENENLAISEVSRANNGVKYWAAAVHPLVTSARVNAVLTLTAKTNNGGENLISVVCEAGTNHTAGGATLANGYTDSAAKTIAEVENNIAGGRTRPAAAKTELTNTALIGYKNKVEKAVGATLVLPAGGTWIYTVSGYGANVGGLKISSASGGATLTMAGANGEIEYQKYS